MSHIRQNPLFSNILVIFISIALYQILRELYSPYWQDLGDMLLEVLAGTPQWAAYQNRLLSPYLVSLISLIGISQISALKVFIFIIIVIQNLLIFNLINSVNQDKKAGLFSVLAFALMFLFIQEYRLYAWDFTDLIIFTLFAWGILEKKRVTFFLILFLTGILNRESVLFIGLFIMADAFGDELGDLFILKSKTQLLLGIIITIGGVLITITIRNLMFQGSLNETSANLHGWFGSHVNLLKNLNYLFVKNLTSFHFTNTIFILGFLIYVGTYIKKNWKFVFIYTAMVLNILIFGVVNESRLYAVLLPFIIFIMNYTKKSDCRAPK